MRLFRQLPPGDDTLQEVLAGLRAAPKMLPAKLFYDAQGSALFESICELPEYYLTRAELALMSSHARAIAAFIGPACDLVEFGSGSGRKTLLLLDALRPARYVPVDISEAALTTFCARLATGFPGLSIDAVLADYTHAWQLPERADGSHGRVAVYFPGSTIGNFTREDTRDFLVRIRQLVGAGGAAVIGVDLRKDPATLHAAYNDAAGITARFNLNLLAHLNARFGADFDLAGFEHLAFYDEQLGRIEMHLRSRRAQGVRLGRERFAFSPGERMRTEISCKYGIEEFQALATVAGFTPAHVWLDQGRRFAVHGLVAHA